MKLLRGAEKKISVVRNCVASVAYLDGRFSGSLLRRQALKLIAGGLRVGAVIILPGGMVMPEELKGRKFGRFLFEFARSVRGKPEIELSSLEAKLKAIFLVNDDFTKVCPFCEQKFLPCRSNQEYCGSRCQASAKQRRHRKRKEKQISLFSVEK